jgi:hypothetical protein
MSRSHDHEGRRTEFAVSPDVPLIIPRDASIAADLDFVGVGTAVTLHVDIEDGRLARLMIDHPTEGWPAAPQILGFAAYPEP